MEYNQLNFPNIRIVRMSPTRADIETYNIEGDSSHDEDISIFIKKEEDKIEAISRPSHKWFILYNEYGIYFSYKFNFLKKEIFLEKLKKEDWSSFVWILFNQEILSSSKYNGNY